MQEDSKNQAVKTATVYLSFLLIAILALTLVKITGKALFNVERKNVIRLIQKLIETEALHVWEGNLPWNENPTGIYATLPESIPVKKDRSYILLVDTEVEEGKLSLGIMDDKRRVMQKITSRHLGRNVFFLSIRAKEDSFVKVIRFNKAPWRESSRYRIRRIRFVEGVKWGSLFYVDVFSFGG